MSRYIDADALIDRLDYCVKEGMGGTIAFTFKHMVEDAPTIEPKTKVVAQVTFDEEKLREIVKRAIERFKEEYEITDRPQGEWIGEADGYYNGELIYDIWYCSNCDYVVDDEEPPTWNFCPNCGARMKGKDNE